MEQLLCGRVGERNRAVRTTHDNAFAHRPDDRVQFRGTRVLGFGQPLEAGLRLDAVVDVAGDGDDPSRLARQDDVLEQHFDGQAPAGPMAEREGDGPRLHPSLDQWPQQQPQLLVIEVDRQRRGCRREERLGVVAQLVDGALVDVRQLERRRVEHEDRVERRVEDPLVTADVAEEA